MANLLSLRRRIRAAQNVSKTTRAMQMIAASKLKRAQDATLSARPYVEKLTLISQNLAAKVEKNKLHEYLKKSKEVKKVLIIAFSPDKGLCGGLITNLGRELINSELSVKDAYYVVVGKKIESTLVNLQKNLIASFKFGTSLPAFDMIYPISKIVDEYFLTRKVDEVKILSTSFTSVFSQSPKITKILPLEFTKENENTQTFTLFEPDPKHLLPTLLKHYLEMTIYQHLLESFSSEQSARMIAMQNATDNAREIVQDLQLEYNKERQEKITNEILDIGGASFTYAFE